MVTAIKENQVFSPVFTATQTGQTTAKPELQQSTINPVKIKVSFC